MRDPSMKALGSLEGITAWKEGTAYLASLDLWEGVKVESFVAQFARPGGVALGLESVSVRRFASGRCLLLAQRRAWWLWIPPSGVLTWMWLPLPHCLVFVARPRE